MAKYFNKNVKYIRLQKGMSQQYLADKIGIDRSTISRIENDEIETTIENALLISKVFNISIVDLISKDLEANTSSKQPTTEEEYKQILRDKGLMDENDNINEEDFKKLIDFAVANKDFIIKKDKD